jgi:hypothetical protein
MDDAPDSARPAVLPMALVGVLGLLAGFAGGYFKASHDHALPESAPSAATAATRDHPVQYSEQKVSPPPPSTAPAQSRAGSTASTEPKPVEPPPVVQEAPPARHARPDQSASTTPHEPSSAHATGTLIVKSTPSKAGVTVNTKWRGRTPLTLDRLPFGRYVVRIVQPGFRVAQEEFSLGPHAASHTFNVYLEPTASAAARHEPAPAKAEKGEPAGASVGTLFVDSRPRGASVLLDGRNIGVTPLMLDNVSVGSHVVKIEMTGKRPWSSTTSVAAGETARVTGSLEDK